MDFLQDGLMRASLEGVQQDLSAATMNIRQANAEYRRTLLLFAVVIRGILHRNRYGQDVLCTIQHLGEIGYPAGPLSRLRKQDTQEGDEIRQLIGIPEFLLVFGETKQRTRRDGSTLFWSLAALPPGTLPVFYEELLFMAHEYRYELPTSWRLLTKFAVPALAKLYALLSVEMRTSPGDRPVSNSVILYKLQAFSRTNRVKFTRIVQQAFTPVSEAERCSIAGRVTPPIRRFHRSVRAAPRYVEALYEDGLQLLQFVQQGSTTRLTAPPGATLAVTPASLEQRVAISVHDEGWQYVYFQVPTPPPAQVPIPEGPAPPPARGVVEVNAMAGAAADVPAPITIRMPPQHGMPYLPYWDATQLPPSERLQLGGGLGPLCKGTGATPAGLRCQGWIFPLPDICGVCSTYRRQIQDGIIPPPMPTPLAATWVDTQMGEVQENPQPYRQAAPPPYQQAALSSAASDDPVELMVLPASPLCSGLSALFDDTDSEVVEIVERRRLE